MEKDRLLAFSDGVIAIIITIMVLELKAPHGADWKDLGPLVPGFLSYVLSFTFVAIYWNNHHHMLYTVTRVNGTILWANTHLLFWLSLIPFATAWSGENHFAPVPTALYGVAFLMPGCAYYLLARAIIRVEGTDSTLARALGRDIKGKGSIVIYAAAVGLAFVNQWVSMALYVAVALMWLIPDRRIERALVE
ncbi:MAG TPA: TMEM175 family protein [Xanthobacteraceae bacterium]|nr:TMEM175 family protein [Xanthobacteraceae bacterium]